MTVIPEIPAWRTLLAVAAAIASVVVLAQPRIALVIGNEDYRRSPLNNPVSDARLIVGALEKVGFDVELRLNADRDEMTGAIIELGKRLRVSGTESIGFFYYAGHGVQSTERSNYLVPIGADIQTEAQYDPAAVSADWVQRRMVEAGNAVNVLVLDACRNNPYARTRGARGLAPMRRVTGSLTAFSAGPGQVATDGELDGNSPYAIALARHIKTPGRTIPQVFQDMRREVLDATDGRQQPEETSQLVEDHYFVQPAVAEGDEVRLIQTDLNAMGFYAGAASGRLGEDTRRALAAFIRTRGAGDPGDLMRTQQAVRRAREEEFHNILGCQIRRTPRVVQDYKEVPRTQTRWEESVSDVAWRLNDACVPDTSGNSCQIALEEYAWRYDGDCSLQCANKVRGNLRLGGHILAQARDGLIRACAGVADSGQVRNFAIDRVDVRECQCERKMLCPCWFEAECRHEVGREMTVMETVRTENTILVETEACRCRAPEVAMRECEIAD